MPVITDAAPNILATPIIGYRNLVTASNVSANTSAAGFPASNLANPATHLVWKSTTPAGGSSPGVETISAGPLNANCDYVAIAKHNFAGSTVWINTSTPASPGTFTTVVSAHLITDNTALIFRFPQQSVAFVTVNIIPVVPLIAAVMYAGTILDLGRGIKAEVEHTPITRGRHSTIVNGMSEDGNFLGRIVLAQKQQTKAEFFGFTDPFYLANVDAFVVAAQQVPFFWAFAPSEYPNDTGYAWLMSDPLPGVRVDTNVRGVSLTLELQSVSP